MTRDALWVGPHFPFNLMFLPEFYGLEYRIRGREIVNIEQRRTILGAVRREARSSTFDLNLKHSDDFRNALLQIGVHAERMGEAAGK